MSDTVDLESDRAAVGASGDRTPNPKIDQHLKFLDVTIAYVEARRASDSPEVASPGPVR